MGPPAKAMRSLGDKIASSIVAQSAGVPTLEWNGTGQKLELCDNHNKLIIMINYFFITVALL